MREDVQDKDPACPVVDARDQAIVVPFDVEDGSPSRHVCVGEIASNIREVPPLGTFRDSIPVHQGDVSISVSCRKAQDRRSADHPHTCSLQNENLRVKRQFPRITADGRGHEGAKGSKKHKDRRLVDQGPLPRDAGVAMRPGTSRRYNGSKIPLSRFLRTRSQGKQRPFMAMYTPAGSA